MPRQPFLVLRLATKEEWLEEEIVQTPTWTLQQLEEFARENPHFYEISVD